MNGSEATDIIGGIESETKHIKNKFILEQILQTDKEAGFYPSCNYYF